MRHLQRAFVQQHSGLTVQLAHDVVQKIQKGQPFRVFGQNLAPLTVQRRRLLGLVCDPVNLKLHPVKDGGPLRWRGGLIQRPAIAPVAQAGLFQIKHHQRGEDVAGDPAPFNPVPGFGQHVPAQPGKHDGGNGQANQRDLQPGGIATWLKQRGRFQTELLLFCGPARPSPRWTCTRPLPFQARRGAP